MGLLIVLAGSLLIAVFLDVAWEDTVPATFFTVIIATFLLGIFEDLDKVMYLKYGLTCCIAGGYAYCLIIKKMWRALRKKISIQIILFLLSFGILSCVLTQFHVISWDDLNHWAVVIKQTFYEHQIPTGSNSISAYSDYQPLGALASYWFLSDFGTFREELIFQIQLWEIYICFLPFWKRLPVGKGSIEKGVLGITACLLLPFTFSPYFYLELEIDNFVAVLFLYAVICIWEVVTQNQRQKDWYFYTLITTAGTLAIAKSVGIYLCAVLGVAVFMLFLFRREIKMLVTGAGMLLTSYLLWYLWKMFCEIHGNSSYISEGFSNIGLWDYLGTIKLFLKTMPWILWGILVGGIILIVISMKTDKETIQKKQAVCMAAIVFLSIVILSIQCHVGIVSKWFEGFLADGSNAYVIRHYLYAFCTMPTIELHRANIFGISFMDMLLIIFGCSFLFVFILDKNKYVRCFVPLMAVLGIGWIIYMIGHASMYTRMFSGSEKEILSAFSRYMRMYASGVFGVVLYILYSYCSEKEWKKSSVRRWGLWGICALLLCNISSMAGIVQYKDWQYSAALLERRNAALKVEEVIRANTEGAYQYVWCGKSTDSWAQLELRYLLTPLQRTEMVFINAGTMEDVRTLLAENRAEYFFIQQTSMTEEEKEQIERLLEELDCEYIETESADTIKIYKNPAGSFENAG